MRSRSTASFALLAAAALWLQGCAKAAHGGAGVGEGCSSGADCARPLSCDQGKCTLPAGLAACVAGNRRCDGADLLECDPLGLHETLVQTCEGGCQSGACVQAVCTAGARRCGVTGVEVCGPGAQGANAWVLAEACPAGCDAQTLACTALVCRPMDVRCSATAPGVVQLCAPDGSSWVDEPCAAGSRCQAGACVALRCQPGLASCDGSTALVCNATGSGYSQETACAAGCANGSCLPAACAPGQARCEGSALEECRADGSGFSTLRQCASPGGCIDGGNGRASCAQTLCLPLARRCSAQNDGVEVCAGDGSAWAPAEPCDNGCAAGACLPPPAGCAAGQLRCAGAAVQRCDGTAWNTVAECLGGCSAGGVCSGGSCATGFALAVPLPSCAVGGDCVPPADGASSLLATVGPIRDLSGNFVADGTLITAAATGGAVILAAPGTHAGQVRTHGGLADFSFRAPPASALDPASNLAYATITASVAGADACAASTTLPFGNSAKVAYVAEDFTTTAARDVSATTADWRTDIGDVEALHSEFGDGSDGDLAVSPAAPFILDATPRPCAPDASSCAPYAAQVRVIGFDPAAARVEGALAGFAPGDEALLIELQGASPASTASAGAWELVTVASVSEGRVAFTAPVAGSYGAATGAPLNGERVMLQRVPHFRNVSVPALATISASSWNGQLGGVLAFRASGTVSVGGTISGDGLGYRGGVSPDGSHGQAGESFGGTAPLLASSARNLGAGGGGYLCGDPFHLNQLDTWYGAGGSYGTAGVSTCSAGVGLPYGSPTLARLFFGSGSGSQEQNTHGPCSASTCPAESGATYGFATKVNGGSCVGQACLDTFSFCSAETTSFGSASVANNAGCTSQGCVDTFNSCSPYTQGFASAIRANNSSCGDQSCANTFASCGGYTGNHAAAALPCDSTNNPGCQDTFNSCGGYNIGHSNSPYPGNDCASACPRKVTYKADCGLCGCSKWNAHDCTKTQCDPDPNCFYVCTGHDCGGDGTTGFFGGCSQKNNTCAADGNCNANDYCTSNCNVFGANCDCHHECFQCWNGAEAAPGPDCNTNVPGGPFCNSCNTCTGCVTNPGCQTNPGCYTNPGCQTNNGCNTCGGRISGTNGDGTACDYTNPSNTCRCPLPWTHAEPGAPGGGIVFVAAATLDIAATGRVSTRGFDARDTRDGSPTRAGGAGGSLWLRLGNLKLATGSQLSAAGGVNGGGGRIRLEQAAGSSPSPAQITPPTVPTPFALPAAQSLSILRGPLAGKLATSAALAFALDAPPQSYSVFASSTGQWTAAAPGGSAVAFGASTDVRWRVLLSPQSGHPARSFGLLWLLRLQ